MQNNKINSIDELISKELKYVIIIIKNGQLEIRL